MNKVDKTFILRENPHFFKLSKRKNNQFFSVFYAKIPGFKLRALVIVSKKHVPLATDRNKLKRQFKAAFTATIKDKTNIITVFRLKPSVKNLDYQTIIKLVEEAIYD